VTEREEHEKLADELEQESDRLERRSDELGDEISDTRDDWQRKRNDDGVPGAPPPEGDTSAAEDDRTAPEGDEPEQSEPDDQG
jgi:hypothetical protein